MYPRNWYTTQLSWWNFPPWPKIKRFETQVLITADPVILFNFSCTLEKNITKNPSFLTYLKFSLSVQVIVYFQFIIVTFSWSNGLCEIFPLTVPRKQTNFLTFKRVFYLKNYHKLRFMTLSYSKEIFYFKRKQLNILSWTTDLYEKRWIIILTAVLW